MDKRSDMLVNSDARTFAKEFRNDSNGYNAIENESVYKTVLRLKRNAAYSQKTGAPANGPATTFTLWADDSGAEIKTLKLYTDASCSHNCTGVAATAWVLNTGDGRFLGMGAFARNYEERTTTQHIELDGMLDAMALVSKRFKSHESIVSMQILCDNIGSVAVFNRLMERRPLSYRNFSLPSEERHEMINVIERATVAGRVSLRARHVKGHNGQTQNSTCDRLADAARNTYCRFESLSYLNDALVYAQDEILYWLVRQEANY